MGKHGTFINLMTDSGFKRLYGTEKFKPVLIRLLNATFASECLIVEDVTYLNVEALPAGPDGKK